MGLGAGTIQVQPDERLAVRDPARGIVIEELPIADDAAVAAAVARARVAQAAWAERPVRERARLLRRARRELVRDRAAVLERLERETGKARVDVVGELMGVCIESGYLMRRAPRWLRPLRVSTRPLFGKRGRVVFKPRGVVGVISPWNAPLNLALGDAVPALLAGNAVVVKPSELAPLAVSRAVEAMNRVLPPDLLQVVIGAGATGAALVDHVDMVCVTGSPETGRRVMERASRRLTPVLLELGGKDPMIVLADADLDRAARAAAWGGCMMSGQVCMSVERVYVEASVAEAFTQKLVAQVSALRVGPNGPDADIDYGAFTSPRQIAIVEAHLADAVAKGARVLCGGRRCGPETGHFLEPTVLTGVTHGMRIMREESFGPVIPVMAVRDAEEALALANDCEYGLNASVWTRDLARGMALAARIESGNVCVNECVVSAGVPALPFGGVKQSGLGTRHGGAEGLRQFCVRQAMLIEPGKSKTDGAWFPYSARRARVMERVLPLMFGW
ncbi:MAG TPA: aldehyde dehydrogenase family protein [Candidatus Limnocylindria bacterium]|nr:aldehyde dehydrogenase family protein [Candidatus Limnocylindria bacterium]